MKTASLNEIKTELGHYGNDELVDLCMRLAKYKKDNKELLTYLLFEAIDENSFIESIKKEIDCSLDEMNRSTLYFAKKTIRKILRFTNKYIKYSGSKQTEVELLIYFCSKLKASGLPVESNNIIFNIYIRQIQRIKKALSGLHEDLQFDYKDDLESLALEYSPKNV